MFTANSLFIIIFYQQTLPNRNIWLSLIYNAQHHTQRKKHLRAHYFIQARNTHIERLLSVVGCRFRFLVFDFNHFSNPNLTLRDCEATK